MILDILARLAFGVLCFGVIGFLCFVVNYLAKNL